MPSARTATRRATIHADGITTDARGVLAHDRVGERVVRRHPRPIEQVVGERGVVGLVAHATSEDLDHIADDRAPLKRILHSVEPCELVARDDVGEVRQQAAPPVLVELGEALADALGELARRLAGEGQAEDLVGAHMAVRDEPEHAHRHGLGLAAACACDHERRRRRRFDDPRLVGGGREQVESPREHVGREAEPRGESHELTAPIV